MTTDERPIYRVTLTDDEIESLMASESPAAPTQRDSIMRVGIVDRLLSLVDELGIATVAYGEVVELHAAAVIAAYEADATLAYGELDFRAKCYGESVPGKNEAERKVNLDLAVMDDETLSELRVVAETCRHARTREEATLRRMDVAQRSLRAQIAALTVLAH